MTTHTGITTLDSQHGVEATVNRLIETMQEKGITIFARIDHQANAAGAGLSLPPTQVVIFGKPTVGTHLMRDNPQVALDLPSKFLVREDADGQVRLSYNTPDWLTERHQLGADSAVQRDTLATVLAQLARHACG